MCQSGTIIRPRDASASKKTKRAWLGRLACTLTLEELPEAEQDWVLSGNNLLLHAVDVPDLQGGLQPSRLHTIPPD